MSTLQIAKINNTLEQLADFELQMGEIKVMSVETPLDRTKKNLAVEKLYVHILQRMLAGFKHSPENLQAEFTKLLAAVKSLRELVL